MPKRRKRLPFPVDAYPQWLEWVEQHSSSASDDGRWVPEPHASVLMQAARTVERRFSSASKERRGAMHGTENATARTTTSPRQQVASAPGTARKGSSPGRTPRPESTPSGESALTRPPHRAAVNDAASSGARFWALLRGTAEKNPWAGTALIVPYEALTELQVAAGRILPTDEKRLASVCALLASCDRMLKWLAAASKEGARGALRAHNGLRRFKQLRRELEASFESVPPRSTDDTGLSLIAQAAMNLRTTGHDMGPNDVCIDKQAVEKLRRGTELVRVELQEREAKAAEDAATTSPRRRPKRGGRPAVTKAEARKREALVDKWQRAKTARTGQKEFCEDAGISLRELIRAINWLTQRRRRNGA